MFGVGVVDVALAKISDRPARRTEKAYLVFAAFEIIGYVISLILQAVIIGSPARLEQRVADLFAVDI